MLSQIDVFHDCFDQVEDPRVPGRTTHPLNSVLFLVVAATIADAYGPEEIECFGNERLDWLSRFADFPHGIPSHDTIGRVLSLIRPEQFQQALLDWHTQLCQQYRDAEDKRDRDEEQSLPIHVAIVPTCIGVIHWPWSVLLIRQWSCYQKSAIMSPCLQAILVCLVGAGEQSVG